MTPDEWQTDAVVELCDAVKTLASPNEVAAFLRDLCTRRELSEMASRWHIVRLLEAGMSYREVAAETGASTATVTRVSQWLHHGTGGYQLALDRMKDSP